MARIWFMPLAGLALASTLVTACGSSTKAGGSSPSGDNSTLDPSNLVTAVFAAVQAAHSFHVVGSGTDNHGHYSLDVHFGRAGGSGYFAQGSERFDLAGQGRVVYVKASAASWRATVGDKPDVDSLAAMLAAHWVKVPADTGEFAQLLDYVDKDHFVASFEKSAASGSGPFEQSGTATVRGTDAVVFTDTKDQSKIYIAAHGAPRLLKVDGAESEGNGDLTISEYDQPFTPTLPPDSQVIDYTSVVK